MRGGIGGLRTAEHSPWAVRLARRGDCISAGQRPIRQTWTPQLTQPSPRSARDPATNSHTGIDCTSPLARERGISSGALGSHLWNAARSSAMANKNPGLQGAAMTRYEWTPASEPPSDSRPVLLLLASGDWHKGFHTTGAHPSWWIDRCNLPIGNVTHWRDVEQPNSSATLTGSDEGK
jgi:hypothetical protein